MGTKFKDRAEMAERKGPLSEVEAAAVAWLMGRLAPGDELPWAEVPVEHRFAVVMLLKRHVLWPLDNFWKDHAGTPRADARFRMTVAAGSLYATWCVTSGKGVAS